MNEDFNFVRLTKQDAVYFKELDPFEKLELLSMPYGFALGVVEDNDEDLIPTGLLIGTASEEMITIEWMVIEPTHQYQGLGEELLDTVFRMAVAGNIPTVAATLLPEYEKEVFAKGAKSYFEERLFTKTQETGADAFYQVIDFLETDLCEKGKANPAIRSLSEMTKAETKECLDKLSANEVALYTFPLDGFTNVLDKDLCFVAANGNSIDGAIMIEDTGDCLIPVYFYSKNEELTDDLIAKAINAAAEKHGKSYSVFFMMKQPETVPLAKKLFGPQEKGELALASVKDYLAMETSEV